MRLELDEEDLKEEHKKRATSSVGFDHLNSNAQEAVRVVGKAMFYHCKGTIRENHNAVYPPK